MTIIELITQELNKKCIMHKTFCNEIGVSPSTFSNWIKRNTDPPLKYMKAICSYFNWDYSEIINRIGDAEPVPKTNISNSPKSNFQYKTKSVNYQLDPTAEQLLQCFNSLSLMSKAKVMSYIAELIEIEKK